jgi:hypothetical protein
MNEYIVRAVACNATQTTAITKETNIMLVETYAAVEITFNAFFIKYVSIPRSTMLISWLRYNNLIKRAELGNDIK